MRRLLPAALLAACAPAPSTTPPDGGSPPDAGSPDAGAPTCVTSAVSPTDEWSRCLGEWSKPLGVAADAQGNVYVAAQLVDRFDAGDVHLVPVKGSDPMIVKYSPQGEVLWARQVKTEGGMTAFQYPGFEQEGAYRITVLADGSLMVAGRFPVSADFGEGVTVTANVLQLLPGVDIGDINDGFVARYDADGHPKWAKLIGASPVVERFDWLLSDAHGGAYLSGNAMFQGASITFDDLRLDGVGHLLADGTDEWQRDTAGEWKTLAVGPAGEFVTFGYGERPPATPSANAIAHPGVTLWNANGTRRWHHPQDQLAPLEMLAAAVSGDEVLVAATIPYGTTVTIGGTPVSRSDGDLALLRFDATGNLAQLSIYDSNAPGVVHDATLHVVPGGVVLRSSIGIYELTLDAKERQRRRIGSHDGALAPGNHLVIVDDKSVRRLALKP